MEYGLNTLSQIKQYVQFVFMKVFNRYSRCFYFILLFFLFIFLDVFSMSLSDVFMNLAPWTGFHNAVLQPPSTSNPKSRLVRFLSNGSRNF